MSDGSLAVQLVVNGIAIGAVYGIIALGFTVIWKSATTANFAQGDSATVGMFAALAVSGVTHSLLVGLIGGIVAGFALGLLVERLAIRPVRAGPPMPRMVTTIGASMVISGTILVVAGPAPRTFPAFLGSDAIHVGSIALERQYLGTMVVAALLICFLEIVAARTIVGQALRAVGENRQVAGLMGIDERRAVATIFGFSSALGAVAGVLIAPFVFASPTLDLPLLINALLAAVIGGIGSYTGALVGGLIIGVVSNAAAFYVSGSYRDVVSFSVLIALLVLRPAGLLTPATREV
jgi:branched-chain amino acid transport system permease protein